MARLIGSLLGWDERTVKREVETYGARVAAERMSQDAPDYRAAEVASLRAPDSRPFTARKFL